MDGRWWSKGAGEGSDVEEIRQGGMGKIMDNPENMNYELNWKFELVQML